MEIISPCEKCGKCCVGKEIRITPDEYVRIRRYLKEKGKYFKFYVLKYDKGIPVLIIKNKENGECVFLENGKCMIHEVKPFQCKSYPAIFNCFAIQYMKKQGLLKRDGQGNMIFVCESGKCKIKMSEKEYLYWESVRAKMLMEAYLKLIEIFEGGEPAEEIIKNIHFGNLEKEDKGEFEFN